MTGDPRNYGQLLNDVIFVRFRKMYIELNHDLQPGKIENINKRNQQLGTGDNDTKIERKWDVHHGDLAQSVTDGHFALKAELIDGQPSKFSEYQVIAGTKCDIYFDHDWGFFAAVLACYNNHWVLKTSPDDWWNVIVRVFAQAIDSNGDKKGIMLIICLAILFVEKIQRNYRYFFNFLINCRVFFSRRMEMLPSFSKMQGSFISFYKMQGSFYKIFHAGSLKFLKFIEKDPCVHACA